MDTTVFFFMLKVFLYSMLLTVAGKVTGAGTTVGASLRRNEISAKPQSIFFKILITVVALKDVHRCSDDTSPSGKQS